MSMTYLIMGNKKFHKKEYSKKKNKYIQCLIATAFIANPHNKKYVNHKDKNRSNNISENLEWATNSENMKHAYKYA